MKKIFTLIATASLLGSQAFAEELNYEITAKKLDESRTNLSPKT